LSHLEISHIRPPTLRLDPSNLRQLKRQKNGVSYNTEVGHRMRLSWIALDSLINAGSS
jgi:hypothetical protein